MLSFLKNSGGYSGDAYVTTLFCSFYCIQGVTRLADISLHNPVSISVLDKIWDQPNPKEDISTQLDSFAIPESLDQRVVLVPSKLRLVCLAAFILQKCKVGL